MKRTAVIALVAAFLAFAASDIVSRDVFERLPHLEDEFAYLFQARIFADGETSIDLPRPVRAYWQPFLISLDGQRFGKYPPGWPAVLAAGDWMGQLWVINAWLAMLTAAVVYRLGRACYNAQTGAVAALLAASSPGLVLLSGTLMAHTAALFFTTLFMLALWYAAERPNPTRRAVMWGMLAGFALGMVVIIRPLSAAGAAAPFALFFGARTTWAGIRSSLRDRSLYPLLALAGVAILVSLLWPAFNYSVSARDGESFPHYLGRFVSGDRETDFYRTIWDYDRVGFGEGHGRIAGGHTPKLGWEHAKRDVGCSARDLIGWALPAKSSMTIERDPCLANGRGFSWVPILLGITFTFRRRWTWLLLGVPVGIVAVYIAYWIGGSLYSTRYYAEAATAAILLAAAGISYTAEGLARWRRPARWIVYGAFGAAAIYVMAVYNPARIEPLTGYGRIQQAQIDAVNAMRREPERPLLVIAVGDHHWRDVGALMAITTPARDSDIVLARDPDEWSVDDILAQWPDREVIYFVDGELTYTLPPE
ncbi:MAG: phospholipid carrier-dependent glycosyltransferase [Anaerolineae bacterium]|nr:phospholipid carrier-dependent glycosyltransferase [Anaerolineae bacterium]